MKVGPDPCSEPGRLAGLCLEKPMEWQLEQDPDPGRATDQPAALELTSTSLDFRSCEMGLRAVSTHMARAGQQGLSMRSGARRAEAGQEERRQTLPESWLAGQGLGGSARLAANGMGWTKAAQNGELPNSSSPVCFASGSGGVRLGLRGLPEWWGRGQLPRGWTPGSPWAGAAASGRSHEGGWAQWPLSCLTLWG